MVATSIETLFDFSYTSKGGLEHRILVQKVDSKLEIMCEDYDPTIGYGRSKEFSTATLPYTEAVKLAATLKDFFLDA